MRYLKSSEAETVEQGHCDQAAKEAVHRRDQTRSSWRTEVKMYDYTKKQNKADAKKIYSLWFLLWVINKQNQNVIWFWSD